MRINLWLPQRCFQVQLPARLSVGQWGVVALLATLVAGLSGCGAGFSTLPGNLTPGKGGGFFSIATTAIPDAVAGRSYTATVSTSSSVSRCNLSGNFPSGMTASKGGFDCILNMAAAPGPAATYSLTLTAYDTSTPAKTDSHLYTLTIRPEFAILINVLAPAVKGRTYGDQPGNPQCTTGPCLQPAPTSLSATAPKTVTPAGGAAPSGNGPLSSCSVTATPAIPELQAVIDPSNPNRCLIHTTGTLSEAAGTYSVTLTTTDNAIPDSVSGGVAVPLGTESTVFSLGVAPVLALNPDVASPDVGAQPGGPVPDAVQGRTYGNVAAKLAQLVYDASGGLGGYIFGLPTPIASPGSGLPQPAACTTNAAVTQATCTTGAVAVSATPGAYTFQITLNDTANTATPSAATSGTTSAVNRTLTVYAPLALSSNLPNPLPDAAAGRAYATGTGCAPGPNCAQLAYSASNGLGGTGGALGGYKFSTAPTLASPGPSFPQGVVCTQSPSNTFTCAASAITAAASTTAYVPMVTVDDTANATTPSGSASSTTASLSHNITVDPALALTPNGVGAAPPPGVQGRTYGNTAAGFQALTYAASGGVPGGYTWNLPSNLPPPVNCILNAAQTQASCSSGISTVTAAPKNYPYTISVSDEGDATTPAATVPISPSITINGPLVVNPPSPFPVTDAVNGRPYGTPKGSQDLTYTSSGGTGTFSMTGTGFPAPITCTNPTPQNLNCNSGNANVSGATSTGTIIASDTGNATTPGATNSTDPSRVRTDTLIVDPPLAATLTQAPNVNPANLLPGVTNRSYGVINAGADAPTYTAAGGLGATNATLYEWCVNTGPLSLPTGLTGISTSCAAPTTGAATESLSASPMITGAANNYAFTVELDDPGNATTPGSSVANATSATNSTNLQIIAPLAIHLTQVGNSASPDPPSLLPGVTSRSYAVINGAAAAPMYTASGGLGGYTFPASPGPFGSGSGFTCSSITTNPYTCSASTVGLASSSTPYALSLTVSDTANGAVPQGSQTSTSNLLVNPTITLTTNDGPSWPDAVFGRAYGQGTGCRTGGGPGNCTAMVYTAQGGLGAVGGYAFPTISSFPTPIACSTTSPTLTCATPSGSPINQAPATYHPMVTAVDVANAATPVSNTTTDPGSTQTDTLIVDPILAVTLTQTHDSPATNPANLLPGVTNRSYGVINAGADAPTYTAAGGLGATSATLYEWCVNTGPLSLPTGLTGISTSCAAPTTGAAVESLSANPMITGAANNYAFTVELDDPGNATTPGTSVANATSATKSTNLLIDAPLALHLTQAGNSASPDPTNLLPGVTNRSYGVINIGAAAPTYTASGGLGGYTFPASPGPFPGGFACVTAASTYTCSASPDVSAAAAAYPLSLTVSDTANAAVPQGSQTSTSNLLVSPTITLTTNTGPSWPDAVFGRAYGQGTGCTTGGAGNCAAMVYTVHNGLGAVGGYTFPTISSFPTPVACTLASPTLTCATPSGRPINQAPATYHPMVTAVDVANAATPAATTSTDSGSTQTDTLIVDPILAVTLTQTHDSPATNPPSLLQGVANRSYGVINGGSDAPTYTATGGLGATNVATYEWCVNTGAASLPAGLTGITGSSTPCASFGPTGTATATLSAPLPNGITASITPPSQNFPFTVELDDTGNVSTPSSVASSASAPRATSLLVNAPLEVHLAQTGNAASPDPASLLPAVTNRTYGFGGGTPTYTARYGLGGYTFPASPGPFAGVAGFACSSNVVNPYTCSANAAVSAAPATYSSLSLTVSDTANAAVPSGNSAPSTTSLLVNPQLTVSTNLSPTPWPDAVQTRPYGLTNGFGLGCTGGAGSCTSMIYTAAGGLGAVGGYTFPTTSNIPTPIACTLASPTLTCATTPGNPITQAPATYHPTVTAVDVANAATPAANTTSDPASIRPNTDTLNVRPEISFTPPGSAPDAVNGKSYGTDGSTFGLTGCTPGPVCATLNYVINNGLGNYIDPGTLATAGPVAFATCHFAVPHTPGVLTDTYKCSTSSVSQGAGGYALTMSASDTGNAAAPGVTKSDSAAVPLTVHSALSLAVTNPPGVTTTFPDGVVHRDYGVRGGHRERVTS